MMKIVNEFKILEGGSITSPKGFKASGIYGGIKKAKKDVAVIMSDVPAKAAGTFTTNKVVAAPVIVSRENINNAAIQAIVINSGNANACTGLTGLKNAWEMAEITAHNLGINKENVIVSSTGVIGVNLDMDIMREAIKTACSVLSYSGGQDAAQAIMTTDTVNKEIAVEFELHGKIVKIGAMAKGSGMIHPNMATMLCFVTTDVNISKEMLDKSVKSIVNDTFNMITVDGDTSTNDMAIVVANGMAGNPEICEDDETYEKFYSALYHVLETMSIKIARDGEGASKLITVIIENLPSKKDAKKAAKAVIESSLVKTAVFGQDANWGRIMCAIGYSGIEFNESKVDIYLKSNFGCIKVAGNGESTLFDESFAMEVLKEKEITILVDFKDGEFGATAWGCDLTFDYIKINASYRS